MLRPILTLAIVGCLAGAGVTGCTSGSGTTTTVTNSQTLAEQLAAAFCGWQAYCGQTSDAGASPVAAAGDGGDLCVARAQLAAEQQLSLLATAYAEGLLTINLAVATVCADAYQARTCGGATSLNVDDALADAACAGLFTGYIPIGERCDMTAECVGGTYCLSQATGKAITSVQGAAALGICFPYQPAGAACNSTDDCAPPLTCDPTAFVCG